LHTGKEVVEPVDLGAGQGIALAAPLGHRLPDDRHDKLRKARPSLFERRGQELKDRGPLAARNP
jgi:hypothetical protein